ncbi:MAG: TRL domain-containing protein, partial [Spirochaetota bacterium]
AAANGGITEISTYDVKVYTIGSLYVEYTTIVTGN